MRSVEEKLHACTVVYAQETNMLRGELAELAEERKQVMDMLRKAQQLMCGFCWNHGDKLSEPTKMLLQLNKFLDEENGS